MMNEPDSTKVYTEYNENEPGCKMSPQNGAVKISCEISSSGSRRQGKAQWQRQKHKTVVYANF